MKDVDLYLKVRHAVRIEGLSERAAARRFGIDPRTVNKMMKFSVPPGYVRKKPPAKPKLDPFIPVIDRILGDDKSRPKKQLVPVTIVDLKEVVRGEFAENAHRKDFLPSEIEAIRRALEPCERAAAKERQRQHGGTAPGRKHSAKVSPSVGRTVNRIGAFAGISGRSLEKIRAVVEAAEQKPRKFSPLVTEMDRTRRVDSVYRKLRQMQDEEKRLAVKPLTGKFRTLCALILLGPVSPARRNNGQGPVMPL